MHVTFLSVVVCKLAVLVSNVELVGVVEGALVVDVVERAVVVENVTSSPTK